MRVKVEWSSTRRENYDAFCKKYPSIKISFVEWKMIIYAFNEEFKEYILQTGEKAKLPQGFGEFTVSKRIRKKVKTIEGKEYINLPIDWQKTKEKGKVIYNFNYHTEGYFFGWHWFKTTARLKFVDLWWFKPSRVTSRLLAHYIKSDDKYQHLYQCWKT